MDPGDRDWVPSFDDSISEQPVRIKQPKAKINGLSGITSAPKSKGSQPHALPVWVYTIRRPAHTLQGWMSRVPYWTVDFVRENVPRELSDEAHRPHEKSLHHAQPYKVQSCVEP